MWKDYTNRSAFSPRKMVSYLKLLQQNLRYLITFCCIMVCSVIWLHIWVIITWRNRDVVSSKLYYIWKCGPLHHIQWFGAGNFPLKVDKRHAYSNTWTTKQRSCFQFCFYQNMACMFVCVSCVRVGEWTVSLIPVFCSCSYIVLF